MPSVCNAFTNDAVLRLQPTIKYLLYICKQVCILFFECPVEILKLMKFRLVTSLFILPAFFVLFSCQKEDMKKMPPVTDTIPVTVSAPPKMEPPYNFYSMISGHFYGTWKFVDQKGQPPGTEKTAPFTISFNRSGVCELRTIEGILTETKSFQLFPFDGSFLLIFPDRASGAGSSVINAVDGKLYIFSLNKDSLQLGSSCCQVGGQRAYFVKQQ